MDQNYRVILIGAVKTSLLTLKKLAEHKFNIVGVFGYEPKDATNVSGLTDMSIFSKGNNIPYFGYQNIIEKRLIEIAQSLNPDIIFAVGFSQLLSNEWLEMPRYGCIGFHPMMLPKGRGRAPVAWSILEERSAAATFFLMNEIADSGPILAQKLIEIEPEEDAQSLGTKINKTMTELLDTWLPDLKRGIWNPQPQDESLASYYGVRRPSDGWIDWNKSAIEIDLLIKATTHPYPGAYFYYLGQKIIVRKSKLEKDLKMKGVVGRVLLLENENFLVQCGDGLIWIKELEIPESITIKVGSRLKMNIEDEIIKIRKILKDKNYE